MTSASSTQIHAPIGSKDPSKVLVALEKEKIKYMHVLYEQWKDFDALVYFMDGITGRGAHASKH